MNEPPWYETFFGADYLRLYLPFLPPAKAEQDVKQIITLLELQPGDHILDLCCGYGRHALELAHYGCIVTGQDLSETMLQTAQINSHASRQQIRWVRSDMREIPFVTEFNAIISMFTSFGYFQTDDDDQQVLHQIAKALKPGGLFLLETIYQPRVIRATAPHGITRYPDGLIVLEERHINLLTSHNEVHISLINPEGPRTEYNQSIRVYTLTELVHMLRQAGLELQSYYGDLAGNPLTLETRLVLISQKR